MFDDQQPITSSIPSNLPVAPEPEDMFAGVEQHEETPSTITPDALRAGLLKKKESDMPSSVLPVTPPPVEAVPMSQPILGKIILFVVAAVVVGGVGFGGWWVYTKVTHKQGATQVVADNQVKADTQPDITSPITSEVVTQNPPDINTTNPVTNTNEIKNDVKSDTLLFGQVIDSDKDGLDDIREEQIGTNARNSDTDGDTLSDGEEVNVWKTNPLKKDTDNDGYDDNVEIKNNYNPNGPGKLSSLPVPTSTASGTVR